jgi:hypothetical protein
MRRRLLFALVPLATLGVWLAPSSASALFSQCPPIVKDKGCQFLVVVSDGGTQVLQDPTQGPYDPGEEDALLAVQNNSSKPLSSIALYAGNGFFAFDNDGICNTRGEPWPPGCVVLPRNSARQPVPTAGAKCPPEKEVCGFPSPPGEPPGVTFPAGISVNGYSANGDAVTGYEGPTSWFSNISPDAHEGVVNFSPAIAPGASAYFALESPPIGQVPAVLAPTSISTLQSGAGARGASITVPAGAPVIDTAQIAGPQAGGASGTVTYALYKDSKCTVPAAAASSGAVAAGSAGRSAAVAPGPGTYYWQASYSGDSSNSPSASVCGDEVLHVAAAANLGLPATGTCLSKRRFIAHPRAPRNVTLVSVVVLINGKLKFSGKLTGRHTTIDLRGLPLGTFRVAMIATSSKKRVYEDLRRFHTCIPGIHPKPKKKKK